MAKHLMTERLVHNQVLNQAISNTTPVTSTVVDTKDFNREVAFLALITAYTTGDFALQIQHGDESDGSDMANVPASQIVLSEGPLSAVIGTSNLARVSAFGTKRYVRLEVTGSNTPNATVQVIAQKGASISPA